MRTFARSLPVRSTAPLLALGAAFVAAGGYVHLREWLETYRHLPAETAGSAVVRIGFPANAAVSALLAAALAYSAVRWSRFAPQLIVATAVFQVVSLGTLVATRRGTVLGWSEPAWTVAAQQTLAVQIGALVTLAAVAAVRPRSRLVAV